MESNSLAVAELFLFLGLVGWLLYHQSTGSRRHSKVERGASQGPRDEQKEEGPSSSGS